MHIITFVYFPNSRSTEHCNYVELCAKGLLVTILPKISSFLKFILLWPTDCSSCQKCRFVLLYCVVLRLDLRPKFLTWQPSLLAIEEQISGNLRFYAKLSLNPFCTKSLRTVDQSALSSCEYFNNMELWLCWMWCSNAAQSSMYSLIYWSASRETPFVREMIKSCVCHKIILSFENFINLKTKPDFFTAVTVFHIQ